MRPQIYQGILNIFIFLEHYFILFAVIFAFLLLQLIINCYVDLSNY